MISPVPRRARHDGWTPARQAAFLAGLAATRSVSAAAASVGLSASSAYRLRRHPAAAAFRTSWDAALVAAAPATARADSLQSILDGRVDWLALDGGLATRRRPCRTRALIRLLDRASAWQAGCASSENM